MAKRARPLPTTWLAGVYSATIFLSAFLLFAIEPLFAKMVLPILGGTAAVWNTCMVMFQIAMLLGYGAALVFARRLPLRYQVWLHVGLTATALIGLPIVIPPHWLPAPTDPPGLWLARLFPLTVGWPFALLAVNAPLLQRWFSATTHPNARDPYFLYAASNAGSLAGLLSYPFVIEPTWTVAEQSRLWTVGYGLLLFGIAACGAAAARTGPGRARPAPRRSGPAVAWRDRLRWLALAAVPSSVLLGVTTHLTTDVASAPLLWVVPLSLYLLSFVLVFARHAPVSVPRMWQLFSLLLVPLMLTIVLEAKHPAWAITLLHIATFFVACLACHGELARQRPPVEQLNEFYLLMAVGGALGGLFNTLAAPLLFSSPLEYPIGLICASLLRPSKDAPRDPQHRWHDYAVPLLAAVWVYAWSRTIREVNPGSIALGRLAIWLVPALLCLLSRRMPIRFGYSLAALFLAGYLFGWQRVLLRERSFFGTYQLQEEAASTGLYHTLLHGTTIHGRQRLVPAAERRTPLSYYNVPGPIGQVFDVMRGRLAQGHLGMVGLGAGTLAGYAQPGQRWTFFEIDPLVVQIAKNPWYFTYLHDCPVPVRIVLGDARRSLQLEPDGAYDLLVIDAFSSDAIPAHLMTREALALYRRTLAPGGLVAFHISNRHLRLEPVVGALAHDGGWSSIAQFDIRPKEDVRHGIATSHWVVLATAPETLEPLRRTGKWKPVALGTRRHLWTDDYSNLVATLKWK